MNKNTRSFLRDPLVIFGVMRVSTIPLILTIILLFFVEQVAQAQQGLPFMTQVEFSRQFSDSRISSMVQDSEEAMLFASSRGLLKYDGTNWTRIATSSPVLQIFRHAASNRIFVGLKNGAAEVVRSDSGSYVIRPIAGISSKMPVQHIIGTQRSVFFIGENEIHEFTPEDGQKTKTKVLADKFITGAFINKDQLYVLIFGSGLFRWKDAELEEIKGHRDLAEDLLLFSFESKAGTYIGSETDVLYQFDGTRFRAINGELQKFLSDNILSDGLLLNDSLMALSTLTGGAVVVNIQTSAIAYRFDYTTGARDNEVFCLGKDRDNGLWLAYEIGLARVDLAQPIKNFTGFPGLEGNLTTSHVNNGLLYVGTGNGVFMLKEASNRAELDRMMEDLKRKQKEAQQLAGTGIQSSIEEQASETGKEQELIDRFLENPEELKEELSRKELRELKKEVRKQRKKDRKEKTTGEVLQEFFTGGADKKKEANAAEETSAKEEEERAEPEKVDDQTTASTVTTSSKPVLPQNADTAPSNTGSHSFLFKKIKGIDVKCRQLISIGDRVFAGTNNGLYLITKESATNLIPGLYVNHISVSNDGNTLLIASPNGLYELTSAAGGKWTSRPMNDSLSAPVYNAIEDKSGNVWAGTDSGVNRYAKNGKAKQYRIPDVTNERVLVTYISGQVYFLLPSSVHKYDAATDAVIPATLPQISDSERSDYLLDNDNRIWTRSSFQWKVINGDKVAPLLPYLDLFEDIRHLSTDKNGNIYVIDKGANLYAVMNRPEGSDYKFNIYIQQVVDGNGRPFSLQEMKIQTDGGALIFNVSAPFYLRKNGTQYQYRIEGHRNTWSRWDDNGEIDPGNFSPGNYVLQVRARNLLGEVSEIKTLQFSVPRPLLLRWYFILLYVVVFLLLIYFIIKVRERALRETQRILEEKVTQRTAELEKEKVKTEELLLNILPKDTAEELQKYGKATARHYDRVSVLFTDFKGFTQFAENTKPEDLVNELHRCFVGFDEIIGKYYLEKIKTIGDAYMCAGGVPIRNQSNSIAITLAALEIRDFMDKVGAEKRERNEPVLEIRIGIHTGPLTAGVVGLKKFAYDIWGDTVNTASRMESTSEPGRVNVSDTTYQLIQNYFECEYRGRLEVKGKGPVEMYFVNRIKAEFSENADGQTPNKALWELIN